MKTLYKFLQSKGYDVYTIGQHKGLCEKPYVVLKNNGQKANTGVFTGYCVVDVLVYYPIGKSGNYMKMDDFRNELSNALKEYPNAKFTGEITPDYIEDSINAYMFSTKLQLFKKI